MPNPSPNPSHHPRRRDRLRIVVSGYLGLIPIGGLTWHYIQYPAGFAALGHDVFYIEDTGLWPVFQEGAAADAVEANMRQLAAAMEAFGLAGRWACRDVSTDRWFGMGPAAVAEVCRTADVFVNVSCSACMRDAFRAIPVRALIDTDPMFTQIQCRTGEGFTPGSRGLLDLALEHTHHFTFGENIGQTDCLIPDCGLRWLPTRQPVCLARWPVTPLPNRADAPFTTLMNWSAGKDLTYAGQTWGQKDREFRNVMTLPKLVNGTRLALAVTISHGAGPPFPAEAARAQGWLIRDSQQCAGDWRQYGEFIRASRGEFSVAKQTYVAAKTGWFSDRSACYLASGRPVILQDTGWSGHLPSGDGLIAFSTLDEAVHAIQRVNAAPRQHAKAARRVAEDYFDARVVLGSMLAALGV